MDKIIEDDELGRLVIRVNSRARSLVFRTKSDAVYVSVPPGTTLKEVKLAIENLRGKLLASRQKIARPLWINVNWRCRCSESGCSSSAFSIAAPMRSEERRVGKECRSRLSPYH